VGATLALLLVAANFTARVVDQDTGELRFLLRHDEEVVDGRLHVRETYRYPTLAAAQADGMSDLVANTEEAFLQGGELLLYTIEQRQRDQHGVIEIDGGTVYYTWISGPERKQKQAKLTDRLAVPSSAAGMLAELWSQLIAGKTATAHLAVVSELDDFGFELKREDADKPGETRVRVKPTNPVIALFAPRLFLRFASRDGKVVSYHGPLNLAKRDGKGWRTLFADVFVE